MNTSSKVAALLFAATMSIAPSVAAEHGLEREQRVIAALALSPTNILENWRVAADAPWFMSRKILTTTTTSRCHTLFDASVVFDQSAGVTPSKSYDMSWADVSKVQVMGSVVRFRPAGSGSEWAQIITGSLVAANELGAAMTALTTACQR
jgi:hypothetical protein